MQTFESARIQTAARAIGVAQSALDWGCNTRRTASSSASR
jgi:alkylation response protein AidB-like acyl-CoA dehydrogenase